MAGAFRVRDGILPRAQTKLGQENFRGAVGLAQVRVHLRNTVLEWLGLRLTGQLSGGTAVYCAEYRLDDWLPVAS